MAVTASRFTFTTAAYSRIIRLETAPCSYIILRQVPTLRPRSRSSSLFSPMPRILPSANSRFSRKTKTARFALTASALGLSIDNLTPQESADVINTVIALYHRKMSINDVSDDMAQSLSRALGVVVEEDNADGRTLRTAINLRFLDAEAIAVLTEDVMTSADSDTLFDWADTLGIEYESDVSAVALVDVINQTLHSLAEVYTFETLAEMSTDALKKSFHHQYGVGNSPQAVTSRGEMVGKLVNKRVFDGRDLDLDDNTRGVNVTPPPGSNSSHHPSLDGVFVSGHTCPPKCKDLFFTSALPFLDIGNILAVFEVGGTILYQVVSLSPVTVSSLTESPVTGTLIALPSTWVANTAGLECLAVLLRFAPCPCVAGTPQVTDLSNSPSADALLGIIPTADVLLGIGSSSRTQVLPPTNRNNASMAETLSSGNSGLAQQDRMNECRGLNVTFHNPDRVHSATNGTGKSNTDSAFNYYIMCISECDRGLPAAQRKFLHHLVSLHFNLDHDLLKPSGITLQAFVPGGKKITQIWQIQNALTNMVRMLDDLRAPTVVYITSEPRFFESLFSGWMNLLNKGDFVGLRELPPDQVLSLLSNKLLGLGCLANSPHSDLWSSAAAQRTGLLKCLEINVGEQVTIAASRAWKSPSNTNSPANPRGNRGGRGGGGGRGSRGTQGGGRGGNSPSQTTLPASTGNSTSSVGATPPVPPSIRALCISALMQKYNQGSACSRLSTCRFDHDMTRNTKAEERKAASNMTSVAAKQTLLTAIG
jgi:hypothetical protein